MEDFMLIEKIYKALYPNNPNFRMRDILAFLDRHSSLKLLNCKHRRNEGYLRSLEKDRSLNES